MPPRAVPEWTGRRPESMPGKLALDRISRRQDDRCACCGQPFDTKRRPQCDHIVPLRDGGQNRESNLQLICRQCHAAKTLHEAEVRTKVTHVRAKHLGLDRIAPPRRPLQSRGFAKASGQRRATAPITPKFDGDILARRTEA